MKQNLVCSKQGKGKKKEKKEKKRKDKKRKKKKQKRKKKKRKTNTHFFPSIYGSFCFTMFVFTFIFVPETKGRSLESMDELFGKVADGKTIDEEESRRGESHAHSHSQADRQQDQQNKVMDVNVAHVEKV